jgi:RNA polymerase sigma factor (sigma-70 family)
MQEKLPPYLQDDATSQYRQLYTRYYPKLYNYGKKFTPDIVLVEDSIQDIFLDYWKRSSDALQPEALNSYLFSAFRYSLFKKIGSQKRLTSLQPEYEEPDFSADHFIIARETSGGLEAKMREALQQLTGRQREALFLRFYEGLSYEEIAGIMGISVKASYKLMARSLLQLKNTLSVPVYLLLLGCLLAAQKNI